MLSDDDSDEGEEGDYTVYECPGLAPVSLTANVLAIKLVLNEFLPFFADWRDGSTQPHV